MFLIEKLILKVFAESGAIPVKRSELKKVLKLKKYQEKELKRILNKLKDSGKISIYKNGGYVLSKNLKSIKAEIVKLGMGYAFARSIEDNQEYFIPPYSVKNAIVGDIVAIRIIKPASGSSSSEAEIDDIITKRTTPFTGVFYSSRINYVVSSQLPFELEVRGDLIGAKNGDRVAFIISKRDGDMGKHKVKIIDVFGDSENAEVCSKSILMENGIVKEFSSEVESQAEYIQNMGISDRDLENRLDLRNDIIFTIDSAYAKDLDDAVSIKKVGEEYELGVHIADVSHYVTSKSGLDNEAFERGTSIYYADQVIPMLPKALSNGICSLTPNEDRLTFSIIMRISKDGKLKSYNLKKSIINSCIKGVYAEINQIFDNTATDDIKQKYAKVLDNLFIMRELANILNQAKSERGAFELESSEAYMHFDNGKIVDISSRERGESEVLIENFMLIANQAAASFAIEKNIPFIYRVHENPSEQKVLEMGETIRLLGIDFKIKDSTIRQKEIKRLLNYVKDSKFEKIINYRVLRMMSKAKYESVPSGHYGLVLDKYSHFTSPIRRYPDLVIHRILSAYLSSGDNSAQKYKGFAEKSAKQSTNREIRAMTVERSCEDCYKAEFMNQYIGEKFRGTIVGLTPQGIYVELDNTVQGRIAIEDMPKGEYQMEGSVRYRVLNTNKTYTVGDRINIVISAVNIPKGNIDFKAYTRKSKTEVTE